MDGHHHTTGLLPLPVNTLEGWAWVTRKWPLNSGVVAAAIYWGAVDRLHVTNELRLKFPVGACIGVADGNFSASDRQDRTGMNPSQQ